MRYAFLICLLVCLLLLLMMLVINSCSVQSCNAGHDLSGQTNKQISIISTSVQKRNTFYQNNKKIFTIADWRRTALQTILVEQTSKVRKKTLLEKLYTYTY